MAIGHHDPPRTSGRYTVKRSPRAVTPRRQYQAVWVDTREPVIYDVRPSGNPMRIYEHSPERVRDMVAKYIPTITYAASDPEELTTDYAKH